MEDASTVLPDTTEDCSSEVTEKEVGYENDVFILGDMNPDLGLSGGPMASTPIVFQSLGLRI